MSGRPATAPKYQGTPCKLGHTERYVKSRHCVSCTLHKVRNTSPEKAAQYRANRKPKAKLEGRRYYSQNRDAIQTREARKRGYPKPTRPRPSLCECCGQPQIGNKAMALDHDHITGKFRGWLCHRCNPAIGALGDNIDGLLRAVSYMGRANASS